MKVAVIAVLIVVLAALAAPDARADTIVLDDGTEGGYKFLCLIHDSTETIRFPEKDPEVWLEFEIGTWTLSVPRSMVRSALKDNDYQRPKDAAATAATVDDIFKIIKDGEAAKANATPTPNREETVDLSAEVIYLVNFAAATMGGAGQAIPVREGDPLREGTQLEVKKNSRAELAVGERIRIGIGAGGQVRLDKMQVDRRGGAATWNLTVDVPRGKVWIEISGLEAGEKVVMRVIGCLFEVTGDSLFSVTSALGIEYDFAYWEGPSELRVTVPARDAGGFNIRPEYMVSFSPSGSSELDETRLNREDMKEWEEWRQFEPVEVALEPRPIPPPLDPLPSKGVMYSLREAAGGYSLDVRPEIKSNVLQDLEAYGAGLTAFRKDVGRYPTIEEGLASLRENPGLAEWDGPYVGENIQSIDPWDRPYLYRLLGSGEGARPVVYSSGQDQVDEFGLGSDIRGPGPSE